MGLTLSGSYLIMGVVGEGGMSIVYLASHARIPSKRYAVKVLRSELMVREEVVERFRREAHAVAAVRHPAVLDIYDVGETPDGRPYIVTELLEGESLGDRLDRGALPLALAVFVTRRICEAVLAAHERGVIHRDLKPDNVFLVGDLDAPTVKVLDFGLARVLDSTDTSLTRTGIVMGTPGYMSPEQALGEKVDHRTDIYGAGAILYAMLTGHAPYEEETAQMTVLAVMNREPTRPSELNRTIPPQVEVIVQRAMARGRDERFASLTELGMALERFETPVGPETPRPPGVADAAEERAVRAVRRRLLTWSVIALPVLLLLLVSAAVWSLELALARAVTRMELVLISVALIGVSAAPGILTGLYLKRVWNNTPRIAELFAGMRSVVLVSASSAGAAALVLRVATLGGLKPSFGWPGWSLLLLVVALLAGGATVLRRRFSLSDASLLRRLLTGPALATTTVVICALLLWQGTQLPGALVVAEPAVKAESVVEAQAPVEASDEIPAPTTSAVAAAPPAPSSNQPMIAPPEELGAAKAKGLAGLLPLAQKYPRDPAVLRPLALLYGKNPRTHAEAVATAEKLFEVAPQEASDSKLRRLLVTIATSNTGATESALQLMRSGMGSAGPDLLYDLYLTSSTLRDRIKRMFEDDGLRALATPAVLVAYEVRVAGSCSKRAQLLPRAIEEGDERVAIALTMYAKRTKRGCGWKKRQPCPPPCLKESGDFLKAANKIRKRRSATPK